MPLDQHDRARSNGARDPWADAPTSELGDQVLPRWFVLTAAAAVLAAIAVTAVALLLPGRSAVPVEARRPPPSDAFTTAVGTIEVGTSAPTAYDAPCGLLDGLRLAGTPADQARLRRGLAALCTTSVRADAEAALRALARRDAVVRYATFEATGVDSTATRDDRSPTVLINTRFQRTQPAWVAPLVVHDAMMLAGDAATATTAAAAREAEALVCARVLGDDTDSRACQDAYAIMSLDDPVAALRGAGFR